MGVAPVDIQIELDQADLRRFLGALKQWAPALATNLRRELRHSGDEFIAEMRETIESLPAQRDYGVRSGIASSIRTQVMTSKSSNGIRIVVSGASLGEHRAMVKALNASSFRHPVFGNRDSWVEQQGRPYFGSVLSRHKSQWVDAIQKAMDDAAQTVMRGA